MRKRLILKRSGSGEHENDESEEKQKEETGNSGKNRLQDSPDVLRHVMDAHIGEIIGAYSGLESVEKSLSGLSTQAVPARNDAERPLN